MIITHLMVLIPSFKMKNPTIFQGDIRSPNTFSWNLLLVIWILPNTASSEQLLVLGNAFTLKELVQMLNLNTKPSELCLLFHLQTALPATQQPSVIPFIWTLTQLWQLCTSKDVELSDYAGVMCFLKSDLSREKTSPQFYRYRKKMFENGNNFP